MQYFLYNIIPLPISDTKSYNIIFILPSVTYLLLSETRNTYTETKDLTLCRELTTAEIICQLSEPLYSTITRPICETELLSPIESIPKSCDTRIIPSKFEIWHKLNQQINRHNLKLFTSSSD